MNAITIEYFLFWRNFHLWIVDVSWRCIVIVWSFILLGGARQRPNAGQQEHYILAVYPLPKRTNSRKHLFISISCIFISFIFCVHIVKHLYKLMLCWKLHIIPTRNSQDMDHWNIYLHFLGHVRLGDSANKCACAKIKIEIYTKLWLLHWTFPFSKAFQKIAFYFYFNSFTMLRGKSGNDIFYWMMLWNRHLYCVTWLL